MSRRGAVGARMQTRMGMISLYVLYGRSIEASTARALPLGRPEEVKARFFQGLAGARVVLEQQRAASRRLRQGRSL